MFEFKNREEAFKKVIDILQQIILMKVLKSHYLEIIILWEFSSVHLKKLFKKISPGKEENLKEAFPSCYISPSSQWLVIKDKRNNYIMIQFSVPLTHLW